MPAELGSWDPAPVSPGQACVVCQQAGWPATAEMTLPPGQPQGLGTLPTVPAFPCPCSWAYLHAPPGSDPEKGCSKELHIRDPHTEGGLVGMGFQLPGVCLGSWVHDYFTGL